MHGRRNPLPGIVAWMVAVLMFFPIFWMVLASFKTEAQAIATPPVLVFAPTLEKRLTVVEFRHQEGKSKGAWIMGFKRGGLAGGRFFSVRW